VTLTFFLRRFFNLSLGIITICGVIAEKFAENVENNYDLKM